MSIDSVFQSFPQLETSRLLLRRMQVTDAEAIFKILADDEVTRYYDDATYTDISQARDQIEAWENGFRNKRCIRWGITRKDDRAVIGTCGYYGFHTWHMRAGIGYELARTHWRQGLMTEALTAILDLGFKKMGLNRIEAVVMPENGASIKLLEKLGFSNEGLLKEYENWGDKGFTDLCMLSVLSRMWNIP
jgi:ribosomal-protein-alanine N-acetyltransferase